jgi:hypothetical protein
MIRIASLVVCAALMVGAVGCYDGRNRGNDPWWNDRDRDRGDRDYPRRDFPDDSRRDPDPNDDCRRNRGRVDERRWSDAVDQFLGRSFRKVKGFRSAKNALVDELLGVRARACDWEQPSLDRLIGRVRDARLNEATGVVE